MSFEIAVPIFGRHGVESGSQQDGVQFGLAALLPVGHQFENAPPLIAA